MGINANQDGGPRGDVRLESKDGAFRPNNHSEQMPQMHYEEFRDSVDGMTIELDRASSLKINPRITATDLVRVIFATDVVEGYSGQSVNLKIIAADESRQGVSYRLDPNEICLIQKFGGLNDHDVRIPAKWNSQYSFLEFDDLRFGSRYVLAFTSAGSGCFAEACMPKIPGVNRVS
jgi:hypothetical protein